MRSFEFITEQTLDEMPLPADWDPAQYQQRAGQQNHFQLRQTLWDL
jgi:hypothetical protein